MRLFSSPTRALFQHLSFRHSLRLFRRGSARKFVCLAIILSLLILPVPKLALNDFSALASVAFSTTSDSVNSIAKFFKSLFASSPQRRQRETLAQRRERVSGIQVSPARFVAYQGDLIQFSALPTDSSGETVQGATYLWASSDLRKLQIDDTGEAIALSPGMVEVRCQAGTGIGTARLLIRPGERIVQPIRNGTPIRPTLHLPALMILNPIHQPDLRLRLLLLKSSLQLLWLKIMGAVVFQAAIILISATMNYGANLATSSARLAIALWNRLASARFSPKAAISIWPFPYTVLAVAGWARA